MDEKSLIKKYQREISSLKQELQQLKSGMMDKENQMAPNQEDLVNLKLQVSDNCIKLFRGENNVYYDCIVFLHRCWSWNFNKASSCTG